MDTIDDELQNSNDKGDYLESLSFDCPNICFDDNLESITEIELKTNDLDNDLDMIDGSNENIIDDQILLTNMDDEVITTNR